jgi:hypothetical protein
VAPARAVDPGRWQLTGWTSVPNAYWQGVTADPSGRIFFDGPFEGLYRTSNSLMETAGNPQAIPQQVKEAEGYNHIGDIGWDRAEGGRVLLPLECYFPGRPNGGNTCGTGSIGVADPATLAMRYYVKLDPTEIKKAMWAEASPDGRHVWTSSGADLLAYRGADISEANAAPGAAAIKAVRRLAGARPPSGITGAVFRRGRLFLAGQDAEPFQVWSLDPSSGARRLEIELPGVSGESEGLHAMRLLGGRLHWLIAPLPSGGRPLTFGPSSALLHFSPVRGQRRLDVSAHVRTAGAHAPLAIVKVTRRGHSVRGATVSLAGFKARTNRRGRARIRVALDRPGRYGAVARKGSRNGLSDLVTVASTP